MKRLRFLFVLGFVLFLGGHSLFAQNKKEKKQYIKEQIQRIVESGDYTINVKRALPATGKAIYLTSPYDIEIKGDSVISYLPYFGRAYSVPYGGGDGLRFSGEINDYSLTYDKKGTAQIKFKTTTKEDTFSFNIQIFDNGTTSIHVTPINRQHISFTGELKRDE